MGRNKNRGFTIIEVMLFLGISAIMLMVALFGTNQVLSSMRFSDSINSFHAHIQKQYNDVLNGVSPSGKGGLSCTGCVLMGKVIHFVNDSDITASYPVIGFIPPDIAITGDETDAELIYKYKPVVTNDYRQEYKLAWGSKFKLAERQFGSPKTILSVAFVRSPKSSSIITYVYNRPGQPTPTYDLYDPYLSTTGPHAFNNVANAGITNICIVSHNESGPGAKVVIAPNAQGAEGIKLESEPSTGDCDGI